MSESEPITMAGARDANWFFPSCEGVELDHQPGAGMEGGVVSQSKVG